jgi:hypothetical protein
MIVVELHKCNLTNHIIESFSEQTFEDSLSTEAIHGKLIKQKNNYSKIITKLVELAEKEREIYSNIIDLVEENKHMYSIID